MTLCKKCKHEEDEHLVRTYHAGINEPERVVILCRRWGCLCGNPHTSTS